ncbi:DNA cytosine methyltransferase [Flavimobilis sp. GY10621]|uniref:DNA (cytosine-5-)-methyltransferase n=1 Tax=Flavimobilis rhizosphaerae TaxID=2775421 RepID=A0ABR9DPY7_9MICO|nr:DNA cytosine methyltransferase [Flavimobilis rhizosphaerae]MBD9699182.1 DNA cytosine methyltransferase [Flavimobilis rhizosphaerae]
MSATRPSSELIRVLDLFAGCGGLTEGLHSFEPNDGDGPVFRTVGAVEWNEAAASTYAANFGAGSRRAASGPGPVVHCGDITGWLPDSSLGVIDVVVGGPPCQGFSGLNREKTGAERNSLWQEFIRVVVATRPKVFVIENVDRFVRSPEFADLRARIGEGDLKDYVLVPPSGNWSGGDEVEEARRLLLNAADFGALQARRRAIVIGVRTDAGILPQTFHYPVPTHARPRPGTDTVAALLDAPGLPQWRSASEVLGSPSPTQGVEFPGGRERDLGEPFGTQPGPFRTRELHITRNPEAVSLARYRAIPPEGNRKDLRGRYLCRFEDGSSLIIAKSADYRGDEGQLKPFGAYRVVEAGVASGRSLDVRPSSDQRVPVSSGSPRSIAEMFRVSVHDGGQVRPATIEYLSTPSWDRHDAGSGDVMGRLRLDHPSVTIRTEFFKPEKGRYLHPTEDRPITHYEAAKLQGFPDDFVWHGSKTEIAKQIGNAVPVPLGRAIAGAIYNYLRPKGS